MRALLLSPSSGSSFPSRRLRVHRRRRLRRLPRHWPEATTTFGPSSDGARRRRGRKRHVVFVFVFFGVLQRQHVFGIGIVGVDVFVVWNAQPNVRRHRERVRGDPVHPIQRLQCAGGVCFVGGCLLEQRGLRRSEDEHRVPADARMCDRLRDVDVQAGRRSLHRHDEGDVRSEGRLLAVRRVQRHRHRLQRDDDREHVPRAVRLRLALTHRTRHDEGT